MANEREKIVSGNFDQEKDDYRGWVVGHFIDGSSPLCTTDLEIKWSRHKKGERKDSVAANQTAKTLFILFSGKFKFNFPEADPDLILDKEGDYVFYDAGVAHSWEVLEDCLAINIRWPSLPGDQVAK